MRNLLRSRRGSAAFATVIALVPLIGAVALGAEAGSWYVTKQHAQNAADSAAYSGALRLACTIAGASCETQSVDYRGKEFAAQNAFCNSGDTTAYPGTNCARSLPTGVSHTVQIAIGDYNGATFTTPAAGVGNAVRATVRQQQPAYLAAVLGLTTVNIPAQAIAQVKLPSKVCALALGPDPNGGGALKLAGNLSNNGTGCPVMSDASVQLASTPTFTGPGWAVFGATGCSPTGTCANPGVTHNYFMPPALDPLQGLNNPTSSINTRTGTTSSASTRVTCPVTSPPYPNGSKCYNLAPNDSSGAYNGNFSWGSQDYVTFTASGTYFFYNASVNITGATVTGVGVNIVLLGNSSLTINGGNINLSALSSNPTFPALNGVLIDDQTTANVNIGGNGVIKLAGAMYFPKADVSFGGTTQPSNTTCSEVIAKTLTMSGGAYLSTDGCAPTTIAYTQVVALVQ